VVLAARRTDIVSTKEALDQLTAEFKSPQDLQSAYPQILGAKIDRLSATTWFRFQVGVSWQTGRSLIAARLLP
jgi:hypothetical protein